MKDFVKHVAPESPGRTVFPIWWLNVRTLTTHGDQIGRLFQKIQWLIVNDYEHHPLRSSRFVTYRIATPRMSEIITIKLCNYFLLQMLSIKNMLEFELVLLLHSGRVEPP